MCHLWMVTYHSQDRITPFVIINVNSTLILYVTIVAIIFVTFYHSGLHSITHFICLHQWSSLVHPPPINIFPKDTTLNSCYYFINPSQLQWLHPLVFSIYISYCGLNRNFRIRLWESGRLQCSKDPVLYNCKLEKW